MPRTRSNSPGAPSRTQEPAWSVPDLREPRYSQSLERGLAILTCFTPERPVLGITPPGTASRVIRTLGGWVAGPDDPEAIAATLETALPQIERDRGAPWGDPDVRHSYAAATVGERFGKVIKDIAGGAL